MSCPCPAGRGRGRGAGGGGCPRYPHPLQAADWDTTCRAPRLRHPLLLAVPPHQLPHRLQPRGCGEAAHHHVASPRPPASGVRPCSRWPRFRWSRAAKLRTSAASFGSSAASSYTRDTGTGESTTRGGLVEARMSCGGNRLGRTHAGRKLLQKLKKSALSTSRG